MSNVTNLNQIRKSKARAEKRAKADENAVRFGLTKAQKAQNKAQKDKVAKDWAGHQTTAPDISDTKDDQPSPNNQGPKG
jgi:hypothetical protein